MDMTKLSCLQQAVTNLEREITWLERAIKEDSTKFHGNIYTPHYQKFPILLTREECCLIAKDRLRRRKDGLYKAKKELLDFMRSAVSSEGGNLSFIRGGK